jgi:hypothetical protein
MFSSIKHRKSTFYFLAWLLVVAGVLQSATRPSDASHGNASSRLTPVVKESNKSAAPEAGAVDEATKARVSAAYNQLPLSFEENRGQVDKQVTYLSRGSTSTLFLTPTEAVLTLHRGESKEKQASTMSVVRMMLHGANRSPHITGEHEMSARTNYFIGNDLQQWHTDVPQYERVRYEQVYPGIDVIYYGQQQSLEYDFEVAPGADPRRIVRGFKGVRHLKIESGSGDLLLMTGSGEVRQHKPVVYQVIDGERREIESRYVMKGKRRVGFKLGAYDRTKQLVIDPVLTYSTYLGGSSGSDYGYGIAVDVVGNAYVTGYTYSISFPILNQYQTYQGDGAGNAFVTKLNTNLSGTASLLYSTYLGGNMGDFGRGIAVDSSGNVYVTGSTTSTNFPLLHQYQTYQGGLFGDAFVTKLNTNLSGTASLVYSTYLGSSGDDEGRGIAVDSSGNAYVTGNARANNFPLLNQYQTYQGGLFGDAFVTKLNTNLSGAASLVYSTFLGGNGDDEGDGIAIDSSGNVYVTGTTTSTSFPLLNQYQTYQGGRDVFVTRLNTNPSGTVSLLYSTYLGSDSDEYGYGIAVDGAGNAYVTGLTYSSNFPTLNQYQTYQGVVDAFVTKLNTNLSGAASLIYSTYLGGNSYDYGYAIAVDSSGNAYVTGSTDSNNFPIFNQNQTFQGAITDAFVTRLNTNLSGPASLVYSTYLGGHIDDIGHGIALDSSGNIYVAGFTNSSNFPIINQYQTIGTAFVTKLTVPGVTHVPGDFDLDGKTDLALWHPTSGDWEYIRSLDRALITQHWGASGDRPVPGHYDGDGRTDLAIYRPTEGNWYIFQSFNSSFKIVHWGASTDIPVAADYDGDGKADVAVYRPSEGVWYVIQSSDNNVVAIRWGISEDKPVPANYDRDGKADLAVYRPSESVWYILQSSNNSSRALQWGVSGDQPVVGDFDGDKRADVAVWRPSTGTWYAFRSSDGSLFAAQWGAQGDVPVPGDYDGDRRTDVAVWRPTTGYWYVLRSSDGMLIQQQFGSSGDVPVPAAYLSE